jgi:hypothetical protein
MNSRFATRLTANGAATRRAILLRYACTNTNTKLTRMTG